MIKQQQQQQQHSWTAPSLTNEAQVLAPPTGSMPAGVDVFGSLPDGGMSWGADAPVLAAVPRDPFGGRKGSLKRENRPANLAMPDKAPVSAPPRMLGGAAVHPPTPAPFGPQGSTNPSPAMLQIAFGNAEPNTHVSGHEVQPVTPAPWLPPRPDPSILARQDSGAVVPGQGAGAERTEAHPTTPAPWSGLAAAPATLPLIETFTQPSSVGQTLSPQPEGVGDAPFVLPGDHFDNAGLALEELPSVPLEQLPSVPMGM